MRQKKQAEITRSPDLDLPPPPHEDVVLIPHVSLQAILVLDSPDVDLRLWNETVAEMEASGKWKKKRRLAGARAGAGAERGEPALSSFMPRCGSPLVHMDARPCKLINVFSFIRSFFFFLVHV